MIKMVKQAQAVLGTSELQVVADQGYINGDEILACVAAGIMAYVPKPMSYRVTLANYTLHEATSDSAQKDVANVAHTVTKNTLIVTE
ncbi:hypothetical protein [Thiobacillus sp.]|uniref:hypothetical protein n=1 Tax=Thiobacillus sp. TaxID=924 RepID=UPI0026006AB8|nr:hypothetical protein [Thiobacillus sp.]